MDTDKTGQAKKIYEEMYKILYRKFYDYNKAWDYLIEFIAVDNCPGLFNQLEHKFEWLFEDRDLCEKIISIYKPDVLKQDMHDHLGDMYVENQSSLGKSFKGQFLTPDNVCDFICRITIDQIDKQVNILDPAVGTGRFLIHAHRYTPNANLFGVDIDLRALRIAFTNCAIHGIRAYFLHADSLRYEIDISKEAGRHNWQYANRWYSCWDKLEEMGPARREEVSNERDKMHAQLGLFREDLTENKKNEV